MARVVRALICRPTSSAELDTVASIFIDVSSSSQEISFEPPSENEILRLARQRIRWHFNNNGHIELDRYVLHFAVFVEPPTPLVLICVTEPEKTEIQAQEFLNKIRGCLLSDAQVLMLLPGARENDLQPYLETPLNQLVMAENSSSASSTAQNQKMQDLRAQVDSVKTVMAQNVERIMERGEHLNNIERRTDDLQASSESFKLTAHRVQRKMCLHNAKWTIISVIAALVVLTIIIIIILSACGVFDKKN